MRRVSLAAVAALVMAACGGSDTPPTTIIVVHQYPDAGASEDDNTVTETPPSGAHPCESFAALGYAVGDRCGLEAPGEATCSEPSTKGYVYACFDKDASPTRPDITRCISLSRADGVTRVLCPRASCVPFEDGRCGTGRFKRSVACPDPGHALDVHAPATLVDGRPVACEPAGEWVVGTARGPTYCCL